MDILGVTIEMTNLLLICRHDEEVIFDFPRSSKEKRLCLTDYFGSNDIVAFQAVTVGKKVTQIISEWNNKGKYADAYYVHGLAVETAEALAEWSNSRIKQEASHR